MIRYDEVFKIGKITRTRGIKGELEMECISDAFDEGDAEYFVLEVDGILVPFFWEEYRFKNHTTIIVLFEGMSDERDAAEFVGCDVYYPFSKVANGDAHLLSWKAFAGYSVMDQNEEQIGGIVHVDDRNDNIVITVEQPSGRTTLLPLHEDLLLECDHKNRSLKLIIPEGLLDLNY